MRYYTDENQKEPIMSDEDILEINERMYTAAVDRVDELEKELEDAVDKLEAIRDLLELSGE
jgi:hypothetical protein